MLVELGMPDFRPKEVSCATQCPAPCCGAGMAMELTPDEATYMQNGGTELTPMPTEPISGMRRLLQKAGVVTPRKMYKLETDCGYLEKDEDSGTASCGAYNKRPQVCRDFRMGGEPCRYVRQATGIDTPEEFKIYWDYTCRMS